MLKKVLLALFLLGNIYAILCGGLYFFQENLIFHPRQLPQDYTFEFQNDFEEVWLDALDGARLHGLHFTIENPKGVIVYFHGNAGDLSRWGELVQPLLKKQYNVVVMDYRGYGKSSGELTQEALYKDSLLWYAFAKAEYPNANVIAYGRSLGTTFATYVASKKEVSQLLLETPFMSIEDEAHSRFLILPTETLLKFKFPTVDFINQVKAPITIFHGTDDSVVDYNHGKELFEHIEQGAKQFIEVPDGGHNNLIEFAEFREGLSEVLN